MRIIAILTSLLLALLSGPGVMAAAEVVAAAEVAPAREVALAAEVTLAAGVMLAAEVTLAAEAAHQGEPEPAISVSPICAYQLSSANDLKAAAIAAAADPDGDGTADVDVDPVAVTAALPVDWLDPAIRSCGSLDDWLGANELYPDALGTVDATDFVHERCLDRSAALDVYATCQSVVTELATPAPVEPDSTPAPIAPILDPVIEPLPDWS